jgi:hypothetical protein
MSHEEPTGNESSGMTEVEEQTEDGTVKLYPEKMDLNELMAASEVIGHPDFRDELLKRYRDQNRQRRVGGDEL